ncbi:hypothetical protein LCGC14_2440900, partial [marine sediment metagenome]
VDMLFNFNEIYRISLTTKNKNEEENLLKIISITDRKYADKIKDPLFKFLAKYERRMGSYLSNIKGFAHEIKVNVAEAGKISLIGSDIKLDKCREWLLDKLVKITRIQDELFISKEFSLYIRTFDKIKRTELYKKINGKQSKEFIYELVEKIIALKENLNHDSIELKFSRTNGYDFRDYLINSIDLRCSQEHCYASLTCPKNGCNSTELTLSKKTHQNSLTLKCLECGEEFEELHSLECIGNEHINEIHIDNSMIYLFRIELKTEINKILSKLETGLRINSDKEVYYIKNNRLYRNEINDQFYYNWFELPSFREIKKRSEMNTLELKESTSKIKSLYEKCKSYKNKCEGCHIFNDKGDICLLKIFAEISDGRAHPHCGFEFGDFEFDQLFSYGTEKFYGIAKSYGTAPKKSFKTICEVNFGSLTYKKSQGLLEQFIEGCRTDIVRALIVVSGKVLSTELKNVLIVEKV